MLIKYFYNIKKSSQISKFCNKYRTNVKLNLLFTIYLLLFKLCCLIPITIGVYLIIRGRSVTESMIIETIGFYIFVVYLIFIIINSLLLLYLIKLFGFIHSVLFIIPIILPSLLLIILSILTTDEVIKEEDTLYKVMFYIMEIILLISVLHIINHLE